MFNEATFVSFMHPGCFGVNTEQCSDRSDDHTTVVVFFLFVFLSSAGQHFVAAHLLPLNIKAVWIVPAKPAITGERLQLKRGSRKKHVGHQMESLLYLFPFVNHLK